MPMKRIARAINLYHRGVMIGPHQRGSARAASRHVGLRVIGLQAAKQIRRVRSLRRAQRAPGPWGKFAKGRGHARPCVEG
jgi:hypothetical protein